MAADAHGERGVQPLSVYIHRFPASQNPCYPISPIISACSSPSLGKRSVGDCLGSVPTLNAERDSRTNACQLVAQLARAPLSATVSVGYLGVFPTAVAFTTWAYALARTTAGKMGATTYLVPVTTVVLSWSVLCQVPGWLATAGGVLCLAGVAVSGGRGQSPRSPAEPGCLPAQAPPAQALDGWRP